MEKHYGWIISFAHLKHGELVEVTSDNTDEVVDLSRPVWVHGHGMAWVDETIDAAYERAIETARVRVIVLEMDRENARKKIGESVRAEMDSLTIGTIDEPLAGITVLP